MLSEKDIATLATVASILEVSSKKPGNVSPEYNFSDTKYEDFLAGSIVIREGIEEAAKRGFLYGTKKISLKDIKIGDLIKKCILDVKKSHSGGNTHLGTLLLMVPISAAVGMCISEKNFNENKLKINVKRIIENSTLEDSLNFYDAIKIANANVSGGCGEKLNELKISFYELMKLSAKKDRIAKDLTNGLKITFLVSKKLNKNYKKHGDVKKAILQTYLEILAKFPDTFIAKKLGKEKAKEISEKAREVVKKRGVFTKEGKEAIKKFDLYFKRKNNENNQLNPGTTADIIAAGLMIWLLRKIIMER